MSRVDVIVVPTEHEESQEKLDGPDTSPRKYTGWVPFDYLAGQLKHDVGRYWQLKPSKYELRDPLGEVLDDDKPLAFSNFHPAVLKLRRRERESAKPSASSNTLDPFWIHDQLFDLFVFNALQNRQSGTLRITSYQFKLLLQKATSKTVYQQKKKLLFDKRVTLAFRGAQSNPSSSGDGIAGANFGEVLDALVDVACFMHPKESTKELALEKLALEHIIPYHEMEQSAAGPDTLSWAQIDDLVGREKVKLVAQRFTKSIGDLATSYSPNVALTHRRCVVGFHEFQRFIRDVIPTTVPISWTEVCKVFMRYCRRDQSDKSQTAGFMESNGQGPEYSPAKEESSASNILSSLGDPTLEIPCARMIDVIGYIALIAVPRLVKAKEKMPPDCSRVLLTSKLGVQSLKTLLHHVSNNLGAKRGALVKKNVEFNRARVHFLLEFNKMHREDSLVDYQSTCAPLVKTRKVQEVETIADQSPSTNQEQEPAKPDESDFDVEFTWSLASADNGNTESSPYDSESSASSPIQRTSIRQVDPHVLLEQRRRELEQLNALCNDADEIYAFLAGELQRHSLAKRPGGADTVPHMLDVWVSAGEKYSDVINHVETSPQLRAKFLARFGRSLYVLASQILKSSTKVYSYQALFHVTNVRVYTTSSDIWRDSSTLFTLDLAMETLSLASGKLTQASDELSALVTAARANDPQGGSDDDESSTGSDEGEPGEDSEAWTASALYERYLCCLYLRANCLAAYADVIAHNKKLAADYELGIKFEEAKQIDERTTTSEVFFASTIVLSKTSAPSEFYWEAKKMFRFLLQHSKGGLNFSPSRLHHNLAMVQFKLATRLPRGCDAEKELLENALVNLDACEQARDRVAELGALSDKRRYIRAVLAARRKFFLVENQTSTATEGDARDGQQDPQDEMIAPFYRFVLAAAFGEFDTEKKGVIFQPELTLLSKACGHSAVSGEALQWLLANFDRQDDGLTERGVLQYFCWLAEADPVVFCEIIDQLTAKHTGAHNISIYSGDPSSTIVPLESIIFNFLERTPLPSANLTHTVVKFADTTCLLSGFPSNLPLFSPTEVDFTILFQCLNPDNILKVYGYLLTEKKVVLSSANRPVLTHVAETLRALLHPFECQHVYIPLLPLSLVEFICAPVPFFMGIRSDQRLERLMAEGVILVDLDNNDIRVPPNEELPILTDVKSRKLLHTLRKLSIWPASQRTRHSFGHGLNSEERPIPPTFEPSQPSDAEVGQAINRHEDLTEKWSEIQTLFSSFATRILKEVRKHCTKAPAGSSSSEAVVFDERGFLAMHPSLRDFCTHLFQTQLFQRSIETIWGISDTSSVTEPEQYWKAVRAKSMLRKNSEVVEDGSKSQRRRVVQAPLPSRTLANSRSSRKPTGDGFPAFNGKLYDDLLEELSEMGELESSVCDFATQPSRALSSLSSLGSSSEASTTSILTSPSFHDGDVDALQLVNAARKRLEGRRVGEIAD
ncbi:hypothetical protein PHYPSEUDO_007112 [Phytophthora pseudosyringae]|uniref:UDENN domain-containing protein n=1 Tax=Phytophthora pseudosyringae TaxID=221518 RepID=A0A8T1WEM7_9STRA|nr:hypothetical protein PHYPSEUDO_007112 [Phytophthora pseudosyringae]